MDDDEEGQEKADDTPRYRGRTYREWVVALLEAADYDPMEFVGKDEKEIRTLVDKNRGLQIALMEIGAIFGDKGSMKSVQTMYTKALTEKAQLKLQVPAPGGQGKMTLTDGQHGEVGAALDRLLRGEARLPETAVPASAIQEVNERFERIPENLRAK